MGATDALPGKLDDVPFHVHCMKEPDYMMMLMSTYSTVNGQKMEKTFKYPEVVYNHYKYTDCIDNHYSQHMHPISLEETWMTAHWPN